MELIKNLVQVKNNWKPLKQWEFEQQKNEKIDDVLRKKYIPTKESIEKAKNYSNTIIDSINIMDKHTIDKSQDANLVVANYSAIISIASMLLGIASGRFIKKTNLAKKLPDWKPYWELLGIITLTSVSNVFLNIWQANVAKKSARIARFQTRENELKDFNNFIVYTKDQKDEAKEIAKSLSDDNFEDVKILSKKHFNPIKMHKDAKLTLDNLNAEDIKYKEWKDNYLKKETQKEEKFKNLNDFIKEEDLIQAEKERNNILKTIKKIENKSNEYSTNMKIATFILSAIITSITTLVGAGLSGVLSLITKNNKLSKKLNNFIKISQFLLITLIPGYTTVFLTAPTVKLVKDAARIGRFKAKQELLNNPEEYIAFSDKERKSISIDDSEVEVKKAPKKGFKYYVNLLKELKNDANEYFNYVNTTQKENEKINKALKKIEVSEIQKKEAKKIQKQLFYAFEKVDEKQVSFIEDTDAIVDIIRDTLISIINFGIKLLPIYVCAKDIKTINKGKMPETLRDVIKISTSNKLKISTIVTLIMPFILPKFINFYAVIKSTEIEKQTGKIGVMTAIKDLEDARNFIVEN